MHDLMCRACRAMCRAPFTLETLAAVGLRGFVQGVQGVRHPYNARVRARARAHYFSSSFLKDKKEGCTPFTSACNPCGCRRSSVKPPPAHPLHTLHNAGIRGLA